MRAIVAVTALALLLLLSGCAGVRAVTANTSEALEELRAKCIDGLGGIWIETRDIYDCRPRQQDPRT